MKSLVVYFSRKGNNYVNGTIRNLSVGNTEVAAGIIAELTGADQFKIEPLVPYSEDYNVCIKEAQADLKRGARPELKDYLENIEAYDTIYLGYPNYWGTMPVQVFTFLEKYDFTGKTIKPFCTHEGSGMGKSERDIQKCCSTATVEKGLAIHGAAVNSSKDVIKNWI